MALGYVDSINGASSSRPAARPASEHSSSPSPKGGPLKDRTTITQVDFELSLNMIAESTLDKLRAQIKEVSDKLGYDLNVLDAGPQATADRIAGFALGLYGIFQNQHRDEEDGEIFAKFENTIRTAIDKGFGEARQILKSMEVLNDKVAESIGETYRLVQERLDKFFSAAKAPQDKQMIETERGPEVLP